MRVTCLSGGVGGAKLARGLQDALSPGELTVIGNVGDDVEVLGLHVSPDLDSILYALAGLNDEERGWGRADESWRTLESAVAWGGEDWFRLGDLDLGLHLVRTQALGRGEPLSSATARLVDRAGVASQLLPATDDRLRTTLVTPAGRFSFQEWFVERRHADEVDAVELDGADATRPAPGVVDAIEARRPARLRAEQPLRLARADPRRADDPRRARDQACALRGREPAHRWPRGQGPARPYAPAHGGRDVTCARRRLLRGPDRRPRDRRRRRTGRGAGAARRHRHADDATGRPRGDSPRRCWRLARESRSRRGHGQLRPRTRPPSRGGRVRRRDRVARRGAGNRGGRRARRRRGDERRRVPWRRPRRPRDEGGRHARDRAGAGGRDRRDAGALGRGRARLRVVGCPAHDRGDVDRRADPGRRRGTGRRRAALARGPQSRRRRRPPRRTCSSAATTPRPRRSCSSSRSGSPPAARSTAGHSRRLARSKG